MAKKKGNPHVKPTEDMTDEDYFYLVIEEDTRIAAALRYLYSRTEK